MRRCPWLAALLGITAALPATAQEGLRIGDAVAAGLDVHRSVVAAEAAARSAALALRLAEIDHSGVAVTLSATPAGSVDLAPLQTGTFDDLADTFDISGSGTVSAALTLPWGMEIAGSYTGEADLDGSDPIGDSLIDTHALSVSQDLLPEPRLAASVLTLADRHDQLRLARLRLWRARNNVALAVAQTFLTLSERTAALGMAEQRLAFAERDLAHTRSRVEQQAADQIDLLDATIAVAQQRNAIDQQRAALALDTAEFFADLGLPAAALVAPDTDLDALRRSAAALLAEPSPPGMIGSALEVLEAQAALASAELQGRTRAGRPAAAALAQPRLPQTALGIAPRYAQPVGHRQLHPVRRRPHGGGERTGAGVGGNGPAQPCERPYRCGTRLRAFAPGTDQRPGRGRVGRAAVGARPPAVGAGNATPRSRRDQRCRTGGGCAAAARGGGRSARGRTGSGQRLPGDRQ